MRRGLSTIAAAGLVLSMPACEDNNPRGEYFDINVASGIEANELPDGLSDRVYVDSVAVDLEDNDNAHLFVEDGTEFATEPKVWETANGVRNAVIVSGEPNDGGVLSVVLPLDQENTFLTADGKSLVAVSANGQKCELEQVRDTTPGRGTSGSSDVDRQFGSGTVLQLVDSIAVKAADVIGLNTLFGLEGDESVMNGDVNVIAAQILPVGGTHLALRCFSNGTNSPAEFILNGDDDDDDDDSTADDDDDATSGDSCSVEVFPVDDAGDGVVVAIPEWAFDMDTGAMVDFPGGDMNFPLEIGSRIGLVMTSAQGGFSQLQLTTNGDCSGVRVSGEAFFDQSEPPYDGAKDVIGEAYANGELSSLDVVHGVYISNTESQMNGEGWVITR